MSLLPEERVWGRMAFGAGLPALARAVTRVAEVMHDVRASERSLVDAVASDYSLTQRVMRLANSAMYKVLGQGVDNLTDAVKVVGFDAVGHLALQSAILDGVDSRYAGLAPILGHANLACALARSVACELEGVPEEEAALYALLENTGAILVAAFLPEEWARIEARASQGQALQSAAPAVLDGCDLDKLALLALRKWNLPTQVTAVLQGAETGVASSAVRARKLALTTNSIARAARQGTSMLDLLQAAAGSLSAEFGVPAPRLMARLLQHADSDLLRLVRQAPSGVSAVARLEDVRERLLHLSGGLQAAEQVMHLVHDALAFDRAAVFLARQGNALELQACRGMSRPAAAETLLIPAGGSCLMGLAFKQDKALFIENAPKMSPHLPGWHAAAFPGARSLVLAPAQHDEGAVLLYGDWTTPRQLGEHHLALLAAARDTLRG